MEEVMNNLTREERRRASTAIRVARFRAKHKTAEIPKKIPMTPAERGRRYRARKKEQEMGINQPIEMNLAQRPSNSRNAQIENVQADCSNQGLEEVSICVKEEEMLQDNNYYLNENKYVSNNFEKKEQLQQKSNMLAHKNGEPSSVELMGNALTNNKALETIRLELQEVKGQLKVVLSQQAETMNLLKHMMTKEIYKTQETEFSPICQIDGLHYNQEQDQDEQIMQREEEYLGLEYKVSVCIKEEEEVAQDNNYYENETFCNNFEGKDHPTKNVEAMENQFANDKEAIKLELHEVKSKLEFMKGQQDETLNMLKQSRAIQLYKLPDPRNFPISTLKGLQEVNDKILAGPLEVYVDMVRNFMGVGDLRRNLSRIFDLSLIFQLNYNGVKNKICLQQYKGLIRCIYEAVKDEGTTFIDFISELRLAIKLHKKKYVKRKYEARNKSLLPFPDCTIEHDDSYFF